MVVPQADVRGSFVIAIEYGDGFLLVHPILRFLVSPDVGFVLGLITREDWGASRHHPNDPMQIWNQLLLSDAGEYPFGQFCP